jgi:hypothetical protein
MKGLGAALLVTLMLVGVSGPAVAQPADAEIFYDLTNLGGARWQYTYTVVNNSLEYMDPYSGDLGVTMFEIYFPARQDFYSDIKTSDASLFSNLAVTGVPDPTKWDLLLVHAEPGWIPEVAGPVYALNAFAVDAIDSKKIYPILAGQSATGFSVAFDYAGPGAPGDQQFSVLDPSTYDSYFDGRSQPNPVPGPPSLFLLVPGVLGLLALRKIAS